MVTKATARIIRSRLLVSLIALVIASAVIPDDVDQKLVVVSGYLGARHYMEAAVDTNADERADLYKDLVTKPYVDACSGPSEQFSMSRRFLNSPIQNIEELQNAVTGIEQNDVHARVVHWVGVARKTLPVQAITVCIFPYSPDEPYVDRIKRELSGNMGFVETGGVLWTQFIPADGWLETLPHMVLHEYHHAARYSYLPRLATSQTLLETLVSEGCADVFALSIRPDGPSKPFPVFSAEEQARVWSAMQAHLDSSDPGTLQLYVFGDGEQIPRLAGYVIGREIALSFVANNPNVRIEEWSAMSAQEFLNLSGYAPGN